MSGCRTVHYRWLLALAGSLVAAVTLADPATRDEGTLLDESEYSTAMEEVVVTARKPWWRRDSDQPQWRKEDEEVPQFGEKPRMQFFPRYSREDRDRYDGVRDRMNREPEIKMFEFRF